MQFINESVRIDGKKDWTGQWHALNYNEFGFDRVPDLLKFWGPLFQTVVSQAGTYLLTGKCHDTHTGIYKAEGGCYIAGIGEMVLYRDRVRFDYRGSDQKTKNNEKQLAKFITEIVLEWNPVDPINSMLISASKYINLSLEDFKQAVSRCSGPFNGDDLSRFFDYNPFVGFSPNKEYLDFCKNITKDFK